MQSPTITHGALFEIVKGSNERPWYKKPLRWTREDGPMEQFVDQVRSRSALCAVPSTAGAAAGDWHEHSDAHHGKGRPPEQHLDIIETRKSGVGLYIFLLNAPHNGKHRLGFLPTGPRFLTWPLNSSGTENFLREFVGFSKGDPRLAAFTCDLDLVSNSAAAASVRKSQHPGGVYIPYYPNFIDPELGAAPWILESHPHARRPDSPHHDAGHPFRTHGGVHPEPAAWFGVPL
jgi:hypothetical protein